MRLSQNRRAVLAAFAAVCLCSSRCALPRTSDSSLVVVSYNLQTLFDDRDDGVEYSGWSVEEGEWDTAGYRLRLKNLSKAILAVAPEGPDILVLQEAENRRVVEDLADLLPGDYPTRVVAGDEGLALRCALVSKLPLVAARAHSISTDPDADRDTLRPMLEAVLDAEGVRLTVLAAHWKSKLGGAESTEPRRRSQAALAARRIREILSEDPRAEVFLVGDLNENPDEWVRTGGAYPTALLPASDWSQAPEYEDRILVGEPEEAGVAAEGVVLWSPWEEYGGYSYVYEGIEERIDNMLLGPGLLDDTELSFKDFSAQAPEGLLREDGTPWEWDPYAREGYSDHLPIRMELSILDTH